MKDSIENNSIRRRRHFMDERAILSGSGKTILRIA